MPVGPEATTTFLPSELLNHNTTQIAAVIQIQVDDLISQGVNKIILLSYLGYEKDLELIPLLVGVDIVLGAHTHTLLSDNLTEASAGSERSFDDRYFFSGAYLTKLVEADGARVCLSHILEFANALGVLDVDFDAQGLITSCKGTTKIPFELTRDLNFTDEARLRLSEFPGVTFVEMTENTTIKNQIDNFRNQLPVASQTVIVIASDNVCHTRGFTDDFNCPGGTVLKTTSQVMYHVCEAFVQAVPPANVYIFHAKGVRTDVLQGNITISDVFSVLPFDNTLIYATSTGAEIKQTLEEAYSFFLDLGGGSGSQPSAFGLRWAVDLTASNGNRATNIKIDREGDGMFVALIDSDEVLVVTSSFLARGRDGFVTFGQTAFANQLNMVRRL
uniref:5'-Nucleotidase C-terminal domain-containing protein n=1 Tax=Chromera velia CCMP2878 TaxID=1169474 RepID=A0A0G4IBQ6_9ALVE|eukprot:Cvel_12852.t1-p1 / transcript=Cvel_12852.t1 / gene=Cvel_12852 / organism=Chromera_velia_CCMP2878 / gene_product=Probable 5'-nucleotidase, putative / transcript_product=Probable 5'-nucleotidase, putative / location=Cvel_scaffold857:44255-45415(+) / protein_length=387 / sequence_SO=supercontig / SO=protein_coding / is_pseudo=false